MTALFYRKYKAFTIAELVVAMLLTSLVISLAYYSFFLFRGQFMQLEKKVSSNNELRMFQKAMQHDIDRANAIRDSAGSYLLMDTITYSFNSMIVRENDTFDLRVIKMDVGYTGKLVSNIIITLPGHVLYFNKLYSAQQLMNE